MSLKYAIHAYAWTDRWSNATLDLIDLAREYGFDFIEIPLMDIDLIDPPKIKERLERAGIGVITSTVLREFQDITSDDPGARERGDRVSYPLCEGECRDWGKKFLGCHLLGDGEKNQYNAWGDLLGTSKFGFT